MARDRHTAPTPDALKKQGSGEPGGGAGQKDEVGHTNVYPASHSEGASGDASYHGLNTWGQKDRGEEGYEDHGESEVLTPMQAELLRESLEAEEKKRTASGQGTTGKVKGERPREDEKK